MTTIRPNQALNNSALAPNLLPERLQSRPFQSISISLTSRQFLLQHYGTGLTGRSTGANRDFSLSFVGSSLIVCSPCFCWCNGCPGQLGSLGVKFAAMFDVCFHDVNCLFGRADPITDIAQPLESVCGGICPFIGSVFCFRNAGFQSLCH